MLSKLYDGFIMLGSSYSPFMIARERRTGRENSQDKVMASQKLLFGLL